MRRFRFSLYFNHLNGWWWEHPEIDAPTQQDAVQYATQRWPHASIIRTTDIADEQEKARLQKESMRRVEQRYSRPRPDFDPRLDYPERYTEGPI
jgi:hypothetical protein